MAIGKLEDPRVLELAKQSVVASMRRMVSPRTPFSTRIHSSFRARGLPVTSRFLDFVLEDLVSLAIVARVGGMYLSIMTEDDLDVFLSAPGFVETISRRAIMRYFSRSVPSLEQDGLTLRRSGEEGSYSYDVTYKAPESLGPDPEPEPEPLPDWMSIPGFDAYIRKQQAALAGARVGTNQITVTRHVDAELTERIDLRIPVLTVPDLGCFVNVSAKDGDITAPWSPVVYNRLPDSILNDHVKGNDRLVLRDGRGRIVKRAPIQEVLDIYLEKSYSEMKERLTDEVVQAASEKLKELRVTVLPKEESVITPSEEIVSTPDPPIRVVEDFPLPDPKNEDDDVMEGPPLTRQPWMDFVTEGQLANLRQAQEVVMKLMDGHGMSRSEMFGKDPTGWQSRFCHKLKAEGILMCRGSNKWARWFATPEGLERLSSIEELIPFVFSPSEVSGYRAFLEHGMDNIDVGSMTDALESPDEARVDPIHENVRADQGVLAAAPAELESRVDELEELVQQQQAMILNLTKQMTVMIGHWQDIKKKVDP